MISTDPGVTRRLHLPVQSGNGVGAHLLFGPVDATRGLERPDPTRELRIDEPEPRRHRCSIVEERLVLDDTRVPGSVAGDDRPPALRSTTET